MTKPSEAVRRILGALLMIAVPFGGAVAVPGTDDDNAAASPPADFTFQTIRQDPDPSSVTAENAQSILDEIAPFFQVQPSWDPPEGADRKAYDEAYMKERRVIAQRRIDLAGRLMEFGLEHPSMSMLARDFFELRLTAFQDAHETIKVSSEYIDAHPEGRYLAEAWGARTKAQVHLHTRQGRTPDYYAALSAIMQLKDTKLDPQKAASELLMLAVNIEFSENMDRELYRHILTRVVEFFPEQDTASIAAGKLDRLNAVGQPFELAFKDAVTGRKVSIEDYRGKIVIVDFWATWCGPCVAEMPKLRTLHQRYKDRGVEVIGVSLDRNVESLRSFLEEHGYSWPQCFEKPDEDRLGNEFTRRWGVNAIPAVFIIDQNGLLHATDARGREEAIILELLDEDS